MKTFFSKNIKLIGVIVLMVVGLSLLVYPFVANKWNNHVQKRLVDAHENLISEAIDDGSLDVQKELELADAYNKDLLPSILPDSFAEAEQLGADELYMSMLNATDDGIMGEVEIPKIAVNLPIFHTTSEEVLQKGVGHLQGSSLPVGGENTHSVLSAHRGLPSATLFTDLDQLEEGDNFFIKIMDEYLAYEVDKISVVEPEDTSPLTVEDGKDLCTLLTCTPYGVNSHRLMVRGHRIEYTPELLADAQVPTNGFVSLRTSYGLWVIVGLAIVALFWFGLLFFDKRKSRKDSLDEKNS